MTSIRSLRATAVVALLTAPLAAPALGQTLEQRLERIAERLEAQRRQFHIPGMSIAIVKDDEVIMSRGFGHADVARGIEATDETVFAAGSTTKAFTATLIGMQVDAGEMAWDDPVRKHLPDYRLSDSDATARVAIRDLLCHRIGHASMTLLWYGNDVTSRDVLETSYDAELLHPFREKWNYSNIGFLAAGTASSNAAGTPWVTLMHERLLEPLGMRTSTLTYDAAQADTRMATGYSWDKDDETLVVHAMRRVDPVAPAGSLNTNAREFAQWVRFQLARGEIDGTRLISEAQHAQTWASHAEETMIPGTEYGLGWFIRDWNGHRVIEHAGGIDGFTAEVALVPGEGIGFALLMNLFAAPLQETSRQVVFDGLLGTWSDDADEAVAAESFDRFVGTYLSSIPQFDKVEVLVQNGKLAVDVPGQMVFELDPPDDEGLRQFAITDQIRVRFTEEDGTVVKLTMYQAGMEFEMPREGLEIAEAAVDVESVRAYLGTYRFEQMNADFTILVEDGRLAIDVPGQGVIKLDDPDDAGRWAFRGIKGVTVAFNEDDTGAVASLTLNQRGTEMTMPRTGDPERALPTVDEVMTLMGVVPDVEALGALREVKLTGTVRFVHLGVEGTLERLSGSGGRMHETLDFGRFGSIRQVVDGDRGRLYASFMPDPELNSEMLEQVAFEHPHVWLVDWRASFDEVAVTGQDEIDGTPVHLVTAKTAGGSTYVVTVDATSGRIVSRASTQSNRMGMKVGVTTRNSDYREVHGFWLPFHVEVENDLSGRFEIDVTGIEAVDSWPAGAFAIEPGA